MPRMTRADFLDQCTGLFGAAARNLQRDGAVHGVVMGLDARGNDAGQLIIGDPAALSDEDRQLAAQHGIITLPGQFRDHAAKIREVFAAHGAVAAVHIAEAWMVSGGAALEVDVRDMAPHDHPDAVDTLLVHGTWPREFVNRSVHAPISTDAAGRRGINPDAVRIVDTEVNVWLHNALPQPPGRRAPQPVG